MSAIQEISTVRQAVARATTTERPRATPETKPAPDTDRVELSAGAKLAASELRRAFAETHPIRIAKVARIKAEIANGTYDIDGKLEAVLDRLLDDL